MLNVVVPTPYGELALTQLDIGVHVRTGKTGYDRTEVAPVDSCTLSGKLLIDGEEYLGYLTLFRDAQKVAPKWQLLDFVGPSSPLPRLWNLGLHPWPADHVIERVDVTPELEVSLDYEGLYARALSAAYRELRGIMLTPNWERWVAVEQQTNRTIDAYREKRMERLSLGS